MSGAQSANSDKMANFFHQRNIASRGFTSAACFFADDIYRPPRYSFFPHRDSCSLWFGLCSSQSLFRLQVDGLNHFLKKES